MTSSVSNTIICLLVLTQLVTSTSASTSPPVSASTSPPVSESTSPPVSESTSPPASASTSPHNGVYIDPKCTDDPLFDKCQLIVLAKYCTHKYYGRFCCKSCTLAGQLPSHGPPLDRTAVYIDPQCTDDPLFDKCQLIVLAKYCTHKYYGRFCCKSCTQAGQLPSHGPHLDRTAQLVTSTSASTPPPAGASTSPHNEMYIDPKCTDDPLFDKCQLIVLAKYCTHKYYGRFCCKSCTQAGQLPSHGQQMERTEVYIDPKCTDNPLFDKCQLIVLAKYCTHMYYGRFCCKSCTLAGQLPSHGPPLEGTAPPENITLTLNDQQPKDDAILSATCRVTNSRPVAKITWLLGDVVIRHDEVNEEPDTDEWITQYENQTIKQTLTRTVTAADSGKKLVCRVDHVALPGGTVNSNTVTIGIPSK